MNVREHSQTAINHFIWVDINVITVHIIILVEDFEYLWKMTLFQFFGHIFLNNGPILKIQKTGMQLTMSSVGTLSPKAGQRDNKAEIGTVPPKSGHVCFKARA